MQQQRGSYRNAWTRASQNTPRSESFDVGEHSGQGSQLNFSALVDALCPSGASCSLLESLPGPARQGQAAGGAF